MEKAIVQTNFTFPNQKSFYKGKVRDVYNINDQYLVMIVSDRISAFDVVLPKGIPFKGQVSDRYIELFESITGDKFQKAGLENVTNRIETNIRQFLATL